MDNHNQSIISSNFKYDKEALEKATFSRLLSINDRIRDLRKHNSILYKSEMQYLVKKRKETDFLLSQIKNCLDKESLTVLKQKYLTFEI